MMQTAEIEPDLSDEAGMDDGFEPASIAPVNDGLDERMSEFSTGVDSMLHQEEAQQFMQEMPDNEGYDISSATARFNQLILWEDWKITGGIFGTINVFFFLTLYLKYTVIYLIARSLLWSIILSIVGHSVCFLWKKASKKPIEEYVQISGVDVLDNWEAANRPMNVHVAPVVTRLAGLIDGLLTVAMKFLQDAVLLRNYRKTVYALVGSYVVSDVTKYLDAFSLVYYVSMVLLIVPKSWAMALKIPQVQEKVLLAKQHMLVAYEKVLSHIPQSIQRQMSQQDSPPSPFPNSGSSNSDDFGAVRQRRTPGQ